MGSCTCGSLLLPGTLLSLLSMPLEGIYLVVALTPGSSDKVVLFSLTLQKLNVTRHWPSTHRPLWPKQHFLILCPFVTWGCLLWVA